jgi:hypothetical protein
VNVNDWVVLALCAVLGWVIVSWIFNLVRQQKSPPIEMKKYAAGASAKRTLSFSELAERWHHVLNVPSEAGAAEIERPTTTGSRSAVECASRQRRVRMRSALRKSVATKSIALSNSFGPRNSSLTHGEGLQSANRRTRRQLTPLSRRTQFLRPALRRKYWSCDPGRAFCDEPRRESSRTAKDGAGSHDLRKGQSPGIRRRR